MGRVFLITGTLTGFGEKLVQKVLDKGDIAVATARRPETLEFRDTSEKNFLALQLDITQGADIEYAFIAAISQFGRIDVVVNNSGYGLAGVFEELTEDQLRKQMEANFFGVVAVTRKAMDVMRNQTPSGGLIQQITSIGGQLGFTEAISHEVKPEWGIKFTRAEPGGFRITDNSTEPTGLAVVWLFLRRHPVYDHIDAKEHLTKRHGTQTDEPMKGAEAIFQLASLQDPPLRVVLGSDAYKAVMGKVEDYGSNYRKYEKISNSTDLDE